MTTLAEIPSCSAFHLPTSDSSPLPLSSGDLVLVLVPPTDSDDKTTETLILSVGSSSFPLVPQSPVQKIKAKEEHPTYVFSPLPPNGSKPVGQVRITLKPSANQSEWEATELLNHKFEAALANHKVWDDTILYVNDEWETGGQPRTKKGWGEAFAGSVIGAGNALAERLAGHTDKHISNSSPKHPASPPDATVDTARSLNQATSSMASGADAVATNIGDFAHSAGSAVASQLPENVKPAQPSEQQKSDLRKAAEDGWEQATLAARGVATAATALSGAISSSAHRAIGHNFGPKAEEVSQNLGQSGVNVGSSAASALKGTSVVVQGANTGSGLVSGSEKKSADEPAYSV
ncbi:uncharacterized protein L203_102525 [Cryptococcus depauperatus CBS 7841]|uniref:Uncharacterized protein n=1 Tax=Cryptococcus depauperatus CBS 7841 TaxID=1295531 RepID=A0A1E3IDH5_9TREE|nr:hypothetical protein L203_03884 [Cryptococcus depauperatus CBS 7841]